MPDAQPKPTASDEQWGQSLAEQVATEALYADEPDEHPHSAAAFIAARQRVRTVLAALSDAGLLATPEHDGERFSAGYDLAMSQVAHAQDGSGPADAREWLAKHDAQVAAQAWAEGVAAGAAAVSDRRRPAPTNPYRAGGPHGTCTIGTDGRCTIPGHAHTDDDGDPT